jgi:hypothetical protein
MYSKQIVIIGGAVFAIAGLVIAFALHSLQSELKVGISIYMSPRSFGCQKKQVLLTALKFREQGDREAVTDLYEKNFSKGKCRDFETDELAIVVEISNAGRLVLIRQKGSSDMIWVLRTDVSVMDLATSNRRALEQHLKK